MYFLQRLHRTRDEDRPDSKSGLYFNSFGACGPRSANCTYQTTPLLQFMAWLFESLTCTYHFQVALVTSPNALTSSGNDARISSMCLHHFQVMQACWGNTQC